MLGRLLFAALLVGLFAHATARPGTAASTLGQSRQGGAGCEPWTINQATLDFIKDIRHFSHTPTARRQGGHEIGYAHACVYPCDDIGFRIPLDEESAEQLLRIDLQSSAYCLVQALLPAVVQLNANQFGALLSWADSQAAVGCSAVQRSDTIARLNAGHEPDTVMRDTLLLSPRQIHWSAARRARVPDFFLQPSNDMAFPACRPGADEL